MNCDVVDVAEQIQGRAEINGLIIHRPADVTSVSGIRVVDVGQGDCIGLLNQDDKVFCYVDFGGFNDHPEVGINNGNPSAHRMPATLDGGYVSVILTHWDKDHCWSAYKKNSDAQNCFWIVPRQFVSPSAARLAAKLTNAKRWPENIGTRAVDIPVGANHRVTIRKCAPFDKNNLNADRNMTGLAITVVQANNNGDESVMLLPGDCPFDKIPNWESSLPIKALVAYHHGSHAHWTAGATEVSIQHWTHDSELAYSVGANTYGHPDKTNYDPDWNTKSKKTGDVRKRPGMGTCIDMKW